MNADHTIEETENVGFRAGVRACVPTLLGYLSIGFAAGVVEHTAGLTLAEIILMSSLVYAGSAQFIAAGMIASHGSPAAIVLTVFFVNLRHLLLSAALSPYFRRLSPTKNALIGALLTDETFGVAIQAAAKRSAIDERWMHGLNVTAYVNWVLANAAGAVFGQWIADPESLGLDFALPAMFIGLLVLSVIGRGNVRLDVLVAVCAVAIVVGVGPYVAGSTGIIVATVLAAAIGMAVERWK